MALGEWREPGPAEIDAMAVVIAVEMLEADALDSSHLFFEELRRIGRALREIRPEELADVDVGELLPAVYQVSVALLQLERRRLRRQEDVRKLKI